MQQPAGINILITGTPGTGKTSMAEMLVQELGSTYEHIEVGKIVKDNHFYTEYDNQLDTHIVEEQDEDNLLDYLEPILVQSGNHVVDYHSSELFPKRWFQIVLVLHTSTNILYDRLVGRGYSEVKRAENLEAEIQCVCEIEAREAYDESCVMIRVNDTLDEAAETIECVKERIAQLTASKS